VWIAHPRETTTKARHTILYYVTRIQTMWSIQLVVREGAVAKLYHFQCRSWERWELRIRCGYGNLGDKTVSIFTFSIAGQNMARTSSQRAPQALLINRLNRRIHDKLIFDEIWLGGRLGNANCSGCA
jgi:hypothetical protein